MAALAIRFGACSTSYEVTCLAPVRTPRPVLALPCGSRSISSTELPAAANAVARLTAVVVLPTPPFWFATAMTYMAPNGLRRPAPGRPDPAPCGQNSAGGRTRAARIGRAIPVDGNPLPRKGVMGCTRSLPSTGSESWVPMWAGPAKGGPSSRGHRNDNGRVNGRDSPPDATSHPEQVTRATLPDSGSHTGEARAPVSGRPLRRRGPRCGRQEHRSREPPRKRRGGCVYRIGMGPHGPEDRVSP